ncbi:MAG: pseudouridine synthase, partial [Fibrobacter sp.]|nr:pseudouridine synthase [Fibrobacter sp.]
VGSDLVPYRFGVTPDGKEASTQVLDAAAIGNAYTLLTLRPLTGRTHQIRVHLASVGNIIVGDKLYGMDEETYVQWRSSPSEFTSGLAFPRHALHCKKLSFMHPYYRKMVSIETEIASDMKDLIKKLEKCN